MSEAPPWIASISTFCRKRTIGASSTSALSSSATAPSVTADSSSTSPIRSASLSAVLWSRFWISLTSLECSTTMGSMMACCWNLTRSMAWLSVGSDSSTARRLPRLISGMTRVSASSLRSIWSRGRVLKSRLARSISGMPKVSARKVASRSGFSTLLLMTSSSRKLPFSAAWALAWASRACSGDSSWCWISTRAMPGSCTASALSARSFFACGGRFADTGNLPSWIRKSREGSIPGPCLAHECAAPRGRLHQLAGGHAPNGRPPATNGTGLMLREDPTRASSDPGSAPVPFGFSRRPALLPGRKRTARRRRYRSRRGCSPAGGRNCLPDGR